NRRREKMPRSVLSPPDPVLRAGESAARAERRSLGPRAPPTALGQARAPWNGDRSLHGRAPRIPRARAPARDSGRARLPAALRPATLDPARGAARAPVRGHRADLPRRRLLAARLPVRPRGALR